MNGVKIIIDLHCSECVFDVGNDHESQKQVAVVHYMNDEKCFHS